VQLDLVAGLGLSPQEWCTGPVGRRRDLFGLVMVLAVPQRDSFTDGGLAGRTRRTSRQWGAPHHECILWTITHGFICADGGAYMSPC
jgi:hypothetical protein